MLGLNLYQNSAEIKGLKPNKGPDKDAENLDPKCMSLQMVCLGI